MMRIRIRSNRASGVRLEPHWLKLTIVAAAAQGGAQIAVVRVEETSFRVSGWAGGRRRGRLPRPKNLKHFLR